MKEKPITSVIWTESAPAGTLRPALHCKHCHLHNCSVNQSVQPSDTADRKECHHQTQQKSPASSVIFQPFSPVRFFNIITFTSVSLIKISSEGKGQHFVEQTVCRCKHGDHLFSASSDCQSQQRSPVYRILQCLTALTAASLPLWKKRRTGFSGCCTSSPPDPSIRARRPDVKSPT